MVFCYQNCSDLKREKNVQVIKKNLLNSRLVTECFFNLFLEVSQTKYELEFKFEKIVGIYKDAGKIRKFYSYLEMNICISE